MTDLQNRVMQAIQAVRTSEPHAKDCGEGAEIEWEAMDGEARKACTCDWQARVDARLAACVEASWRAAKRGLLFAEIPGTYEDFVLAAFLAAAAQKETTK
jgi:hypothetical protein